MARVLLVLALVVAACGGGSPAASLASSTTHATLPPANCPSGDLTTRGDGADYLNISGSYDRAQSGAIPDDEPTYLGPISENIPEDLMIGLVYTGCTSLGGVSNFEEMAWTNGLGLMLISWYEWPKVADPSTAPFGGEADQAGIVEVSTMETGSQDAKMRVVRLFDGLKVVSVSTYGLTTMSVDQVQDVAWIIYDGLPIDMNGAEASGATVEEVLDAVRSDAVTVSEATGLSTVSPFTTRAGAAHTSYSAVIDGTEVLLYDFGTPQMADRAAEMISTDGFSIAHQPYDWAADPHFWQLGRVILLYQGTSEPFIERLVDVLGTPIAGSLIEP